MFLPRHDILSVVEFAMSRQFWIALWWSLVVEGALTALVLAGHGGTYNFYLLLPGAATFLLVGGGHGTTLVQEVVAGALGFTVNTVVYWAVLYVALRRVGKRA